MPLVLISFGNLIAGTYSLTFQTPDNYELTTANAGNEDLDSDADPANGGSTGSFTLTAGENNSSFDAGFTPIVVEGFTISCPIISLSIDTRYSRRRCKLGAAHWSNRLPLGKYWLCANTGAALRKLFALGSTTTIEYYAYDGCNGSAYCSFIIAITDQQDCSEQEGNACDDGDDCTENDVYDANCNCSGSLIGWRFGWHLRYIGQLPGNS